MNMVARGTDYSILENWKLVERKSTGALWINKYINKKSRKKKKINKTFYLFIHGLFNDTVGSSGYKALKALMIMNNE